MILCLDVGNTQIFGGIFIESELKLRFRKSSTQSFSSDEFGIFFRNVLRENDLDPQKVQAISICSVVPNIVYSLRSACRKYFDIEPFFLQAGVRTGLRIGYHNPTEVGTDRIANAMGANQFYPEQNLIIVDLGTATTFCAIRSGKDYLGGTIIPGIRISMEALEERTAKLPRVEIIRREKALGKNTLESIQSGLFYGHLGAMKEIILRLKSEAFPNEKVKVIGTGGFSQLFEKEGVFDLVASDLVLWGLKVALELNQKERISHVDLDAEM
jgi:type III pantothenate kinase